MDGIIVSGLTHRATGRGYLSSDHISAATGLDPAFTISKNGGAFANPAAGASVMTEIESTGWYYFALAAGDTDTIGPLICRGTHATMDNIEVVFQVVSATRGLAGTALPPYSLPTFTIVADGSNSSTTFKTDRTETTDNHWSFPQFVTFLTGDLAGQTRPLAVAGYNGSTKFLTVSAAFSAEPAEGDIGLVINT